MMGQQASGQERLFYAFNLEDHILSGHLLRVIDRCLDLSNLRGHLAAHHSHTGRALAIASREDSIEFLCN